jgi:homoserine kinase
VVSGAGPTVLVLSPDEGMAEAAAALAPAGFNVHRPGLDTGGAQVLPLES